MIANSPRDRLLLGAAVVLAVVKFALLPTFAFFDESREQLTVLTDRLDRSVGVVQNQQAIQKSEKYLATRFSELGTRVPAAESADLFRLEAQQRLGDIVARSEAKLDVFDWVVEDTRLGPGLRAARARLQVSGTVKTIAAMQASLEGELPFVIVRDIRFRTEYPVGFDASGANATFEIDLLFRAQGST
jgi:hypothetical protein